MVISLNIGGISGIGKFAWHGMRIVRKLRLGWFESFVAEQLGQTGDTRGH